MKRVLLLAGSPGIDGAVRRRRWIRERVTDLSRTMTVTDAIYADAELGSLLFSVHRSMGPPFYRLHSNGLVVANGRETSARWQATPELTMLGGLYLCGEARVSSDDSLVTVLVVDDGKGYDDLRAFMERCVAAHWRVERLVLSGDDDVSLG